MSLVISFEPKEAEGQPPRYLKFVSAVMLLVESSPTQSAAPRHTVEQMKAMARKVAGYPGCAEYLATQLDEWLATVEAECEQSRTLL